MYNYILRIGYIYAKYLAYIDAYRFKLIFFDVDYLRKTSILHDSYFKQYIEYREI